MQTYYGANRKRISKTRVENEKNKIKDMNNNILGIYVNLYRTTCLSQTVLEQDGSSDTVNCSNLNILCE